MLNSQFSWKQIYIFIHLNIMENINLIGNSSYIKKNPSKVRYVCFLLNTDKLEKGHAYF